MAKVGTAYSRAGHRHENQFSGPPAWHDYLTALEQATPVIEAIAVTDYYVQQPNHPDMNVRAVVLTVQVMCTISNRARHEMNRRDHNVQDQPPLLAPSLKRRCLRLDGCGEGSRHRATAPRPSSTRQTASID